MDPPLFQLRYRDSEDGRWDPRSTPTIFRDPYSSDDGSLSPSVPLGFTAEKESKTWSMKKWVTHGISPLYLGRDLCS